ncbi:MAG: DUF4097 family beta strand repeat-containing protein [Gemmatimonadaceae bacterium]|nr:DUF4097 family beta strand repeat-containing protein [Gemmatimonadaceae bacterium]
MLRPILLLPIALTLSVPAAAQRPARAELDTTFTFSANGIVDIRGHSADVAISTWNKSQARVVVVPGDLEYDTDLSSSRLRVELRSRRGRSYDDGSRVTITVPVGTRVDVNAVSGDIEIRGTRADVVAGSTSGDVTVEEAVGRVEANSVSGDVVVQRVTNGTVRISSVSGDVVVKNVDGLVSAETVSGDVNVSDAKSSDVRMQTVSGDAVYRGTVDPRGRYLLKSHSGDVMIAMPGDVKADVNVQTFNGEIDSDFPITIAPSSSEGRRVRRDRMSFSINGGGGAAVDLETFSGTILIRRPGARTSRED